MLKTALRDSVVYGLASLLTKGMGIFLLPIYTQVLSPKDFGAFDLITTFGVLVTLSVALEIAQGLFRFWVDVDKKEEKIKLASTALWFSATMYAIFLSVGLIWAKEWNNWITGEDTYITAFRLGLIYIAVNGIYYLFVNQLRSELRSKTYALISLGYALMTFLFAVIFCLYLNLGLYGVMFGLLMASLLSVLACGWMLRKTFTIAFDMRMLREMLVYSVPLVPAGLFVFVSLYINRFALTYLSTLENVGLFGIGSRIAGVSMLLIMGIQSALTPLIYQHYREAETPLHIARLFSWFVAIALLGCLFLEIFSKEILLLFATSEYMSAASLVVYLAPALLLSQMYIFAPGIAIMKKTHWQLLVTVASATTSVIGNLLLVPIWGVFGAALATLLASLVFFAAWLVISQRFYKIPYAWRSCAFGVVAYALASVLGYQIDQVGFDLLDGIVIKLFVMLGMLLAVVATGLLPLSDIRMAYMRIRQYLGECSHV